MNTWQLLLRSASYVCIGSGFAKLMLQEADVAAVTWRVQLAVLKDAKLDVTALSEPIERMMDKPPPGLLSNAQLNVMEEDKQPTELTESNERSDSDSKEERRPAEELQQAEAATCSRGGASPRGRTPAGRSPTG